MKRRVKLEGIRRRAKVAELGAPAGLAQLARAAAAAGPESGWFHVVTHDPRHLGFGAKAARQLVPFLRLGDGGVAAFWNGGSPTVPIVHLDSEGGRELVAASLDDFLSRVARRRSGIPDLDDAEVPLQVPGRTGGRLASLAGLRRAFARFVRADLDETAPDTSGQGEALGVLAHRIAVRMIRDGRSRVYTSRAPYWDMNFRARRSPLRVEYLDFGAWHRVPAVYQIEPVVTELMGRCKDPRRRSYEIIITKDGQVSIDRGRQLSLVSKPPARRPPPREQK